MISVTSRVPSSRTIPALAWNAGRTGLAGAAWQMHVHMAEPQYGLKRECCPAGQRKRCQEAHQGSQTPGMQFAGRSMWCAASTCTLHHNLPIPDRRRG